ncbi:sensor histidine kinase [Marixanthomonas spongiae]|uniref:histidine kinase n=1 Tax=Marixanthomonas spongiae TaxID=2174845 RepID=A0A2U0HUA4_9FLAO|nr:HAMP domain-containing sensor histidine kinase [Marixanthomonas spongiae]PVW12425.1 sensor histidine kinase [Marixanthomonas spongiae]
MKLLNYTTTYFSILLLVLISIWAVLFYYAMFDEIYDSLDDGLENQKMLVMQYAANNPAVLDKPKFNESGYTIKKVPFSEINNFKDQYRDTLMYMQNEEEFEPVRLLESVFKQDDEYYKIKIVTSMVEEDDQLHNLLIYLIVLYVVLLLSILLLNNVFLRNVWKPFYRLMAQLKTFNIEKDGNIEFQPTNIEEFSLLNTQVEKLLEKSKQRYNDQKQFIENAAHELQTPLAITINRIELVLEENDLKEQQAAKLVSALENLERLTRLNKSLLLLSKIDNNQFTAQEPVSIPKLIQKCVADFTDIAAHKNMAINVSEHSHLVIDINMDLAIVLFTNLIKNAVSHGKPGTKVSIEIDKTSVTVQNISEAKTLDTERLFSRFYKKDASSSSTGLGLAISKAIAEKYGYRLHYFYERDIQHFKVTF